MNHQSPYSVSFFERLLHDLPPLFPKADREAMQHALEHMKNGPQLTQEEVEATIITFGKKIWPYRRAFEEFLEKIEKRRADEFFEAHVRDYPELVGWWTGWKERGQHAHHDVFRGAEASIGMLAHEKRRALCEALVATRRDLWQATLTVATGQEREAYEKRVVEFKVLQEAIEERLAKLRAVADMTQEHPRLATEIRQAVRDFEKGLAFLRPHTTFEEVCHLEARVPVRRAVIARSAA